MPRSSLLLSVILSTTSAALLAACGGSTGTEGGLTTKLDGGAADVAPGGDTGSGPTADTGSPDPTDSGTVTPGDDAGPDLPPAVDVFAGTPPYSAPATATISAYFKHFFRAPDYAHQDCAKSGCHDASAGGEKVAMGFGGGVFWADDLTPAPNVEVRFQDATGKTVSVYSNAEGAFWGPAGLKLPGHTGARAGTDDVLMSTDVTKVGCNGASCHDGSAAYPWVTVPRP